MRRAVGEMNGDEVDQREVLAAAETSGNRLASDAWRRVVDAAMPRLDEGVVLSTGDDGSGAECAVVACVNAGFTALTSYRADEVLGQSWELWAPSAINRSVYDHFRSGLDDGRPVRGQVRIVTKGGVASWADTSVIPVRDVDGVHFITTIRAITEGALMH